jgi:protein tyrosine/serine phosphatase
MNKAGGRNIMYQDNQTILSKRTSRITYWGIGVAAILVIFAFSFSASKFSGGTTPANVAAASDNKAEASIVSLAKPTLPSDFPNIKIKNFGKMDEYFYRGAQPKPADYQVLAALGIKTIIDLRDDPTDYEKPKSEAAGIHYVNIPMSDKDRPTDEQIAAFFTIAHDQSTYPFYVHCAGGRHRTGLVGALYRFDKYGWNYDQAYEEMKNYDYYSRWGHGAIKDYVRDYYEKIKFAKPVLAAVQPASSAPTSEPVTAPPPPKPKE